MLHMRAHRRHPLNHWCIGDIHLVVAVSMFECPNEPRSTWTRTVLGQSRSTRSMTESHTKFLATSLHSIGISNGKKMLAEQKKKKNKLIKRRLIRVWSRSWETRSLPNWLTQRHSHECHRTEFSNFHFDLKSSHPSLLFASSFSRPSYLWRVQFFFFVFCYSFSFFTKSVKVVKLFWPNLQMGVRDTRSLNTGMAQRWRPLSVSIKCGQ